MSTVTEQDVAVAPRPAAPGNPEHWVDQYGDLLLSYALRHVGDLAAAEDLVQETFLAAWRGRESFHGKARFETWLVSILRNKIRDALRRAPREHASLEAAIAGVHSETSVDGSHFDHRGNWRVKTETWCEIPDASAQNAEFWTIVQHCFRDLPQHLARAFRLRLTTDDTIKEISASLGISAANLSVRLHRARLALRACLQRKWFGDEASDRDDH